MGIKINVQSNELRDDASIIKNINVRNTEIDLQISDNAMSEDASIIQNMTNEKADIDLIREKVILELEHLNTAVTDDDKRVILCVQKQITHSSKLSDLLDTVKLGIQALSQNALAGIIGNSAFELLKYIAKH